MQAVNEVITWGKIGDKNPVEFTRKKNGKIISYTKGKALGSGERSSVFELIPVLEVGQKAKTKALKVDLKRNLPEFPLIKKINQNGSHTGIVKPPKEFFPKGKQANSLFPMMIMSQYKGDLLSYLQKRLIGDQEVVDALKQTLKGLEYLRDNQFFHGDVVPQNIFIGEWKGVCRYDLADFEFGEDLSSFNTVANLQMRLNKVQQEWTKPDNWYGVVEGLPEEQKVPYLKSVFYQVDAGLFGLCICGICNVMAVESKVRADLYEIGRELMNDFKLEGLREKLDRLAK